jgi:hypothetical protein
MTSEIQPMAGADGLADAHALGAVHAKHAETEEDRQREEKIMEQASTVQVMRT